MGADPPFIYDKPSNYNFSAVTNLGFNPKAATEASWAPKQPKPKPKGPLIDPKELNRHPDSYFIVPYGNLNSKSMSPHTKTIVKWVRIFQLLLRVLTFLGAAGLLVLVICIKPIGSTLDWIVRVPPGLALIHLIYAIYHLSRAHNGRTPGSSASYMVFAAIIDAGLIPFFTLTAILVHNQLYGTSDAIEQPWTTLFGTDLQTHLVIQSTFQVSTIDGALLLTSLCVSIYLALVFRKISKLPPDMNPLEDNLTSRHKRNKSSLSTAISEPINRDSSVPLMSPSRSVPFATLRNDSCSNLSSSQKRIATSNRGPYVDLADNVHQQSKSQRSSWMDINQSRPASTINLEHSRPPTRMSAIRPASTIYSEQNNSSPRPTSTAYAGLYTESPRLPSTRPPSSEYTQIERENSENWISYPSPSPSPPRLAPPELQHLRNFNARQSRRASPPPPTQIIGYDQYDYSNRTPQPLGMHPPTSLHPEHRRSVEARALKASSGNIDGRYGSPKAWHDIRLDDATLKSGSSSPSTEKKTTKIYGDLAGGQEFRQPRQGLGRVVSSGVDVGEFGLENAIRARNVSGKVAEEGRGRVEYVDF